MNSTANKYRYISMLLTVVVFAAALLWLLLTRLSFSLDDAVQWPPKPDGADLLLADEYVEVEMIPPVEEGGGAVDDDGASAPPAVAHDQVDQGTPAPTPSQIVTSTQPSPITAPPVVETPKPTGPSKAEIEAKAREKAQKEATEKANSRVVFGKTPGATGTGDGVSGAGAGNSDQPSNHVGSGSGNAGGRRISVPSSIVSSKPGEVYVDIRVNPAGQVVYAAINPGKSNLADPIVREKCLEAARNAKAVKSDKSTDDSGYIRFKFN